MRWVVLLVVAMLAPGCGAGVGRETVPPPRVVLLGDPGAAPRQGLVVDERRGTLLVGLDGQPYARLVGARTWSATADTARNAAFKALAEAVPMETLLAGRGGRWYVWDPAAGRLRPLTAPRLPLGNGILATATTRATDEAGAYEVSISITRSGRRVMGPVPRLHFVSRELVATETQAVDLLSGTRWRFSRGCVPAGTRGAELFAVCTRASLKGPTPVLALSPHGKRTLGLLPKRLFAYEAMLSPDGAYISANLSPGCGPSYSFLVPTRGGRARPLVGGAWRLAKTRPSKVLGWTQDNRVAVYIARSGSCESGSKAGVYLVDPRTLKRAFVYGRGSAMWSPSYR